MPPTQGEQAAAALQQLYSQFPHLQYRKSEPVLRAEVAFEQQFEQSTRKLQGVNHIQPRVLAEEHLLPIIGLQHQWIALQLADLLQWSQTAIMQHSEAGGETFGIPAEDAESWINLLEDVRTLLADPEQLKNADKCKEAADGLLDLQSAIQELAMESPEDDELDFGDDEGDESNEGEGDEGEEPVDEEPLLEP